ncbi:hypothetical protein M409DRAFT_56460 [Zasmidium cellare ATCC 36951]|uniref:Uncharacterized protein n=1 Tax=Zasmidium cellare ATCC 36951 TaxID=1080233 RepID=A0A6A6CBR8_ZASCE|nr:uncharacterized protein M409DRAFT_56460 [Zasmidium cellare ATCC 36951]KAF2164637.1 hypothetical protein M409DRAFT_56460 [Zasmidium cellare ATCC 36951]
MVPPRPALAQSESKARFFERLGLDEHNEYHRRVYAMMKVSPASGPASPRASNLTFPQEEAVEGRRRMTESQDVLVPSLRNSSVEPPYSNAQISETVTHREILRIYRMARPETRVVYDLGRDTDRVEEENWVIRWMLWHVFRYRDSRNRNRRVVSPSPERGAARPSTSSSYASVGGHVSSHHRPGTYAASSSSSHRASHYWDPVRNQWYGAMETATSWKMPRAGVSVVGDAGYEYYLGAGNHGQQHRPDGNIRALARRQEGLRFGFTRMRREGVVGGKRMQKRSQLAAVLLLPLPRQASRPDRTRSNFNFTLQGWTARARYINDTALQRLSGTVADNFLIRESVIFTLSNQRMLRPTHPHPQTERVDLSARST